MRQRERIRARADKMRIRETDAHSEGKGGYSGKEAG